MSRPPTPLPPTPSGAAPRRPEASVTPPQTLGPFFGQALPAPGGGDLVPPGHPAAITVYGGVYDGDGAPVPDALVETWQAAPDGSRRGAPGSLRRDAATGAPLGRGGGPAFTGWGRVATDAAGQWAVRTLPPGGAPPCLALCVLVRGLLAPLFTRVYLPPPHEAAGPGGVPGGSHDGARAGDDPDALAADPLLSSLPPERRRTLIATAEPYRAYRFDIRLRGDRETVFLAFHPGD
ncbi:protocatechuate 3,4-dioxygenase subunit alpha [Streptomyces sp. URMC 123]|uniref:dioxygenase family protein n=1 Tax=Streptomyces sp. URMC 123 TaxID=3423403 RepID=UPI003F19D167